MPALPVFCSRDARGWGGDSISAAVPPADRQRVIGAALSAHGLAPTKQGGLYLPPSASSKPRTAEAPGPGGAAAQPPPGSEKPPPLEEEDEEQLDFGIDDIEENPPSLVSSVLPAIIRSDTGQDVPELDSKQDQPEDTPRESLAGTAKDTEPAQDAPSGNVQVNDATGICWLDRLCRSSWSEAWFVPRVQLQRQQHHHHQQPYQYRSQHPRQQHSEQGHMAAAAMPTA